ncbi:MAG TPA: hypothetical protein DHW02_19600 [Ktedonobacter sp.]|nr:hypothetical protein [Ktedonobacter sp.]
MIKKIVTIGVYGFDKEHFFKAIVDAGVDTFCDVRARRGVRGSEYTFANSERLQESLHELGIRYIHMKDLAPSQATRDAQQREDEKHGGKRKRTALGETFIREYEQECLAHFDSAQFVERVGPEAHVVCLMCVEGEPQACHRSLLAQRLAHDVAVPVENLTPSMVSSKKK